MNKYYMILSSLTLFLFLGCGGTATQNKKTSVNDNNQQTNATSKPKITLHGDSTIILYRGDTFTDPGAVAFDEQDGDITSSISTTVTPSPIDTSRPGKYKIVYSVTDTDGNKDTKTRVLVIIDVVQNPDAQKPASLVINEAMAANSRTAIDPEFKAFSDWIELYNNSSQTVNLGNYYLSDDVNNTQKWQLPSTLLAPGRHLVIWADKQNQGLHTNFSLNADGETIILSKNAVAIDTLTFDKQKRDISVTNINGENYYMNPTPGQKNTSATNALVKSKKPDFDHESGFYKDSVSLKISQENNATIYYTLDGSTPVPGKPGTLLYTQPLSLSKTTVIRASALEAGKFLSSAVTHTYLINENITLPVMSVTMDEDYLYNPEYGIYTAGNHTNYNQDWIRPGSVEYIKEGKPIFSKNVGIKIHGKNTRKDPQKSLAFYTKSQFGAKVIKYPLFAQKPFIKKVKSFVLRSGGSEWGRSLIADGIQHTIIRNMMDIDYHSFGPSVIMFLNGKYWGLHHVREKMNADYLAANHGVDPKKVDLLANDADVKDGSNTDYLALKAYIRSHDLSDDSAYAYVTSKIDLKEYMNYIITESFTGNGSIHHNIKYWKEQDAEGKWRWMLFDLDRGFKYLSDDALKYVADDDETSIVIRNLLHNQKFIHDFASRYFTHLNTTFQTQRMEDIITTIKESVQPEITRHFQRWPKMRDGTPASFNTWESFIDFFYKFAQDRGDIVREDLRNDLNLTGDTVLTIHKASYGTVKIDDVPITKDFRGTYFTGATVTLEAVPNANASFVQWSDGISTKKRTVTLNANMTISPAFQNTP